MRIGIALDYSSGFHEAVDRIVELEKAGIDIAVVAEAYSFDAVSQLGYLAAKTSTIELASGVFPIYIRTPSLLAMTAAGLDFVSDGRFTLGIGTSGPQVMEGFHGVEFNAPIGRTREIVEICRQVWRRERVQYDGKYYQLPLPADRGTGLGKPLQLINHPVRERIPITIAALGPKNVELTAEIAEGWQPVFYLPEKADTVWGEALAGYDRDLLARSMAERTRTAYGVDLGQFVCFGPEAVVMAPAQSPSPGLGEKYLPNFPVSSQWSRASFGMSFLAVMFGHFCAYSRLRLSHFSRPGSVSGLMASTGHSGWHTLQSMHSSGLMTSMFSPS